MPLPYPEVWKPELGKHGCSLARRARKKSVNLVVALLNWLHMSRPARAPASLALGSRLSKKQWKVVEHFERLVADVADSGDIDAAAMGRTAAKVEGLDEVLFELQRQAVSWTEAGYEHRRRAQSGICTARPRPPGHCLADPGEVVGSSRQEHLSWRSPWTPLGSLFRAKRRSLIPAFCLVLPTKRFTSTPLPKLWNPQLLLKLLQK